MLRSNPPRVGVTTSGWPWNAAFSLGPLLGIAPRRLGYSLWWKIGFEDRFQHQASMLSCRARSRRVESQRPEVAMAFGMNTPPPHPSDGSVGKVSA